MHPLKTVGYGHNDAQAAIDSLAAQGYHIVDIRLKTYSNKPGFSGEALTAKYRRAYHKTPSLGNLNYNRSDSDIELKDAARGLLQLKQAIARAPIVLLCGCKLAHRCHRFYIAQIAVRELPGLEIEHLLQSGEAGMIKHRRAIAGDRCAWVENGKQCDLSPWQGQTCNHCRKPICELHTREVEGFFVDRASPYCPTCYESYLNTREDY